MEVMTTYESFAIGFDRRSPSTSRQPQASRGRTSPLVTTFAMTAAVVTLAALLVSPWPSSAASVVPTDQSATIAVEAPEPAIASPAPRPAGVEVAPLSRPIVVLYGDSLAWEARDAFVLAFAGHPEVEVHFRTQGGIAICDVLDVMASDAATIDPGAVVIQFSGNALTPCMSGSDGSSLKGRAYFDRYEADAEAAIAKFAGTDTQVIFAGAPLAENDQGDYKGGFLNAIYERMGRTHDNVRYVDAGAAVLDNGRWTPTLPCLPGEPCTGGVDAAGEAVNVVRAPDGGHFCPASRDAVRGVTGECPIWSSGAFRFGSAMAEPVVASLASV
jgi:hypothetical protein